MDPSYRPPRMSFAFLCSTPPSDPDLRGDSGEAIGSADADTGEGGEWSCSSCGSPSSPSDNSPPTTPLPQSEALSVHDEEYFGAAPWMAALNYLGTISTVENQMGPAETALATAIEVQSNRTNISQAIAVYKNAVGYRIVKGHYNQNKRLRFFCETHAKCPFKIVFTVQAGDDLHLLSSILVHGKDEIGSFGYAYHDTELEDAVSNKAFDSTEELKNVVRDHCSKNGIDVKLKTNKPSRLHIICNSHVACEFRVEARTRKAVAYLRTIGDDKWISSSFPARRYGVVTSNPVESSNAWIESARHKDVFNGLVALSDLVMERLSRLRITYETVFDNRTLCTHAAGIVKENVTQGRLRAVVPSSTTLFKVAAGDGGSRTVDLDARTCTCLKWDELELPCVHVCAVLHYRHCKGISASTNDPTYYCSKRYLYTTIREMYSGSIYPVDSSTLTPDDLLPTAFKRNRYGKKRSSRAGRRQKKRECVLLENNRRFAVDEICD